MECRSPTSGSWITAVLPVGLVGADAQPGDPPGPHALTSVRAPNGEARDYPYDPNGNMLAIDGMEATWDFDDRLTALESPEFRATYHYDHRDGRIVKRVTTKTPGNGTSAQIESVVYVNQYFEVRENDLPTRYVWCGNTRVARVTGSLSTLPRLQRLRLQSGWNLRSLGLTAEAALTQLASSGVVTAAYLWDATDRAFRELTATDTIPAGSILWLKSVTDDTVSVRGRIEDLAADPLLPAGGAFHPGRFRNA